MKRASTQTPLASKTRAVGEEQIRERIKQPICQPKPTEFKRLAGSDERFLPCRAYKSFIGDRGTFLGPSGKVREMQFSKKGGYPFTKLRRTAKGSQTNHYAHRELMLAFCPIEDPEQWDVEHINGIVTDNYLENLRWVPFEKGVTNGLGREVQPAAPKASTKGQPYPEPDYLEAPTEFTTIPGFDDRFLPYSGVKGAYVGDLGNFIGPSGGAITLSPSNPKDKASKRNGKFSIRENGIVGTKNFQPHVEMMKHFYPIANADQFYVTFVDGDYRNLTLWNLRYISHRENAVNVGKKKERAVVAIAVETNERLPFKSAEKAKKRFGKSVMAIRNRANGITQKPLPLDGKHWNFQFADPSTAIERVYDHSTEGWRSIPNFSRYEIRKDSTVRRKGKHHVIKTKEAGAYTAITLTNDEGISVTRVIHCLVLESFSVDRPDSDVLEGNHKNGKQRQNDLDNLEWTTPRQNKEHAYYVLQGKDRCAQTDDQGNVIKVWSSMQAAADDLSLDIANISKVYHGQTKHTNGYLFVAFPNDAVEPTNQVDNPQDYRYPYLIGGDLSLQVAQFEKNGTFVEIWDDAKQAAKEVGLKDNSGIIRAKKIKNKLAGGYKWRRVSAEMYEYHAKHGTIPMSMADKTIQ